MFSSFTAQAYNYLHVFTAPLDCCFSAHHRNSCGVLTQAEICNWPLSNLQTPAVQQLTTQYAKNVTCVKYWIHIYYIFWSCAVHLSVVHVRLIFSIPGLDGVCSCPLQVRDSVGIRSVVSFSDCSNLCMPILCNSCNFSDLCHIFVCLRIGTVIFRMKLVYIFCLWEIGIQFPQ